MGVVFRLIFIPPSIYSSSSFCFSLYETIYPSLTPCGFIAEMVSEEVYDNSRSARDISRRCGSWGRIRAEGLYTDYTHFFERLMLEQNGLISSLYLV